ncbi:hypothetical protein CYMTET_13976 [Cymbomonas tetramitiformis]|uniref:Uncharacterized protein n=1 Tax=Cymbomonas tetramitiformis TaxID=36881 RepID=A0AAE0LAC4_9CHLO|nr:hypothetical protein CYMTET_13976 [Cymbomonas tetramitiformis]
MSTKRQRARMAAVRSALLSLRVHRHPFTAGYVLVVPGGACAPGTNHNDNILDDNDETNDFHDFVSPLPSPSPYAPSGRHLVVSGGAITTASPLSIIPFEFLPMASITFPHRIFHLPPPYPLFSDAFALLVPGRFWLWHRVGIG